MTTEEINEIINNIIFLQKNTVPTAGNYGADITSMLQQNYDQLLLNKIKFYLQSAIKEVLPDLVLEVLNIAIKASSNIVITLRLLIPATKTYFERTYTL